jgi:uncharacterized membrane protein YkvI
MNRNKIITKIYSSIFLLTLLYGIPFGLIMSIFSFNENFSPTASVIGGLVGGLLFGVSMALTQKKLLHKYINLPLATEPTDAKKYKQYIKSNIVPNSKKDKQELLKYMSSVEENYKKMQQIYYPKKNSRLTTYIILGLFFIATLLNDRFRLLAFIYPLIIIIGLLGELRMKHTLEKINEIRARM